MGRTISESNDDKNEKSSEKAANEAESDSDADLSEEEFIVEKILKMRTTKKREKFNICLNGKAFPIMKIHGNLQRTLNVLS